MVTFITLDSLINGSTNWIFEAILKILFIDTLPVVWSILFAPFTNPSMLWIVAPLIISLMLIQLYFARHRNEFISWDTAFGNSVSLIFVSLNLIQYIYNNYGIQGLNPINPVTNKFYVIIAICTISIIQVLNNYYHKIPQKIAFFVNSTLVTNMTAYILIVLVYTNIPLTYSLFTAYIMIILLLKGLFDYTKKYVPMSKEAEEYVAKMKLKEEKRKELLLNRQMRNEKVGEVKITDSLILVTSLIITFLALLVINTVIILPLWVNLLIQSLIYLLLIIGVMTSRKLRIKNLNYGANKNYAIKGALTSLLLFIIVTSLIYASWLIVPPIAREEIMIPLMNYSRTPAFILIPLIALLMPFTSEVIFRGLIQRSIKKFFGGNKAVIIQAVIYSLMTYSFSVLSGFPNMYTILTVPVLLVAGLILGHLREYWGLESAISCHATFNIIGLILLYATI